jgi:hypothetical protein
MIFDQENIYSDSIAADTISDSATYSDVIANVGGGDAVDPLFLFIAAPSAITGFAVTATLQTSADEVFTSPVDLASYTLPKDTAGVLVKDKVPYGMLKFSRIEYVGAGTVTAGTVFAALTETVPNWKF